MYSYGPSIMSEALPSTQPKINETDMEYRPTKPDGEYLSAILLLGTLLERRRSRHSCKILFRCAGRKIILTEKDLHRSGPRWRTECLTKPPSAAWHGMRPVQMSLSLPKKKPGFPLRRPPQPANSHKKVGIAPPQSLFAGGKHGEGGLPSSLAVL